MKKAAWLTDENDRFFDMGTESRSVIRGAGQFGCVLLL
jgi:hypothetical protein